MLAEDFFSFLEIAIYIFLIILKKTFKESENLEGYKKENLNDLNYITRFIN